MLHQNYEIFITGVATIKTLFPLQLHFENMNTLVNECLVLPALKLRAQIITSWQSNGNYNTTGRLPVLAYSYFITHRI